MTATWEAINELLGDIPDLEGAACRGRHDWYDVEDPDDERAVAARYTCQSCPSLQQCADWYDSLPISAGIRPGGTVAAVTRPWAKSALDYRRLSKAQSDENAQVDQNDPAA